MKPKINLLQSPRLISVSKYNLHQSSSISSVTERVKVQSSSISFNLTNETN